jgi:hypothetical protein
MAGGFIRNYGRVTVATEAAPEYVEFPQQPTTEQIAEAVAAAAKRSAAPKRKE